MTKRFAEYSVNMPEEPPVGSVVLDRDDIAWQLVELPRDFVRGWFPTWHRNRPERDVVRNWATLLTQHGPLRVLYHADMDA